MDALSWQLKVFSLRLCQLVAQVSAFWYFSGLIHLIVVQKQPVLTNQLVPFMLAVSAWAISVWLADLTGSKAKYSLEKKLEAKLQGILQSRQVSLTRKYSATYWQQLLLTNLNDIGDYLSQYSVQKWLAVVAPSLVILILLPVNYIVAVMLLLTLPIVPLLMVLIGKRAALMHRKHFLALERLGDMFSDRLKGLSLVTTTGQHQNQLERLDHASQIVNRKTMKVVSLAFLNNTVLDFFSTLSIALIAVFIGFTMLGELSFGPSISLHQGLFMLLVSPLLFAEMRMLGKLYHQKAKAEAGAERFSEVFKEANTGNVLKQPNDVVWVNFSLSKPKIRARHLKISQGDWVLLTGTSGSGKTSLLEALMGFREASHALSGDVALQSQQTAVLDSTLAFNLHLGHDGYSDDQLTQALDEVELTDWFAGLPKGLDTQLGDYPKMSGGEAHRLALARILLLNKEIILLDEPTAHLTAESHNQLARLIHEKLCCKTVIWASHKQLPNSWFNQHWHIAQGEIAVDQL